MTNKRVFIFSPFGSWRVHGQLEAVVGMAVKQRGAEVLIVGCDGLFRERCYVLAHSKNPDQDCAHCTSCGSQFFRSTGLPYQQLRSYLTPEDYAEAEAVRKGEFPTDLISWMHEGVPLGQVATRSISSLLRANPRMYHLPRVQEAYRIYARDAVLCRRALDRIFDTFKPDQLIAFNGYGNLHGTAFYLAKKRGIEILTHDKGMGEGTFIINDGFPSGHIPCQSEIADNWKDVPLKTEELKKVNDFFSSRRAGRGMNYQLFYTFENSLEEVARQLRIPTGAGVFGVFTSSEYELPFYEACPALVRQLEFIDYLFEIFKKRKDYLVVRHHPLIGDLQGTNPDWDMMTRMYQQAQRAPANVRVIMPHEKITSYAILPFLDACLIPASTIGTEAIDLGVPTASLTGCLQADAVTEQFSDSTLSEMETRVDRLIAGYDSFGIEDYRKLYRHVNAIYYRHPKSFKSFSVRNFHEPDIKITSLNDLNPGKDPELDRVCDNILLRHELHARPTAEDLQRTTAEEDEFFTTWNLEVKDLHRRAKSINGMVTEPKVLIVKVLINGRGPNSQLHNIERQRYRNVETVEWNATSDNAGQALQSQLSTLQFDFIAFELPEILFDESYISGAIAQLEVDPQSAGILRGWWMYGPSKILEYRFSAEEVAARGIPSAPRSWADYGALASLILRRDRVSGLINVLCSPDASSAQITAAVLSLPIILDKVLAVVVPESDRVQPVATPEQVERSLEEAVNLVGSRKYQEGLVLLKTLESSFNTTPTLWYVRAIAEFEIGDKSRALNSVRTLLSKVPDYAPGLELLRILEAERI